MSASGPLAPLRNRDYRYLLAGFAIGQMLMPLQFITQILWVQAFAPRNVWLILVALIAASRGLGALTFGLYGGALADRFDRKKLLIAIQAVQVVTTVAIAFLMLTSDGGFVGFALFFALTFVTAGLTSMDAPTRLAIVPDVLGSELTAAGLSINQMAGQIVMPVAMAFTGIMIAAMGYGGAYLFSATGHVVAIVCLAFMSYQATTAAARQEDRRYGIGEAVADVRIGLHYARNQPVVLWTILLLVTMMSFGYPAVASLGPTWVTTVVEVPIARIGFVVMFWAIGSFVAAALLTRFSSFERRGALVAFGTLVFSVSFVIFVYDHTELNVIIGNLGLGAGMTTAMVSSTILIQEIVPNEIRGRIMSIFQLNMAFAQLMTMPVAIFGQWLTLVVLFPVLSWVTLALVIVILATQTQIWRTETRTA